jgi:hypothetical protein
MIFIKKLFYQLFDSKEEVGVLIEGAKGAEIQSVI